MAITPQHVAAALSCIIVLCACVALMLDPHTPLVLFWTNIVAVLLPSPVDLSQRYARQTTELTAAVARLTSPPTSPAAVDSSPLLKPLERAGGTSRTNATTRSGARSDTGEGPLIGATS